MKHRLASLGPWAASTKNQVHYVPRSLMNMPSGRDQPNIDRLSNTIYVYVTGL